jgi:hypothetical protein
MDASLMSKMRTWDVKRVVACFNGRVWSLSMYFGPSEVVCSASGLFSVSHDTVGFIRLCSAMDMCSHGNAGGLAWAVCDGYMTWLQLDCNRVVDVYWENYSGHGTYTHQQPEGPHTSLHNNCLFAAELLVFNCLMIAFTGPVSNTVLHGHQH